MRYDKRASLRILWNIVNYPCFRLSSKKRITTASNGQIVLQGLGIFPASSQSMWLFNQAVALGKR